MPEQSVAVYNLKLEWKSSTAKIGVVEFKRHMRIRSYIDPCKTELNTIRYSGPFLPAEITLLTLHPYILQQKKMIFIVTAKQDFSLKTARRLNRD